MAQPKDGFGNGSSDAGQERRQDKAVLSDVVHELRNGLAGVRGAVQVVRDPMPEGMEREILAEVLQRLDLMDQVLLQLASTELGEER
jgi:nitrogen-specific signal transduction histidine kinase